MLTITLQIIHWGAALVILMEAVDKLHACYFREQHCAHGRLIASLKALAWIVLALAAAGAISSPLFRNFPIAGLPGLFVNPAPSLGEVGMYLGFAVLIARSWLKEFGRAVESGAESVQHAAQSSDNVGLLKGHA